MHKGVLAALWTPSPEVGSLEHKTMMACRQRQHLWLRKKLFFPVVLIKKTFEYADNLP